MNDPELILLDTHIWLWLMSGSAKATSAQLRSLVQKLAPKGKVCISTITLWEIGMLLRFH